MRGEGGGGGAEPLKLEGLVAAMLWQRRSKHDPPTPNPPLPPGVRGGSEPMDALAGRWWCWLPSCTVGPSGPCRTRSGE